MSHIPPIAMSEEWRRSVNNGNDISIVAGLHRLRAECLDRVHPDTIIVIDTHWYSTFEHIVSAHAHRAGVYTSEELPRGMCQIPYAFDGDPELAALIATQADGRDDTWIHASHDSALPIHYPTVNLLPYLHRRNEKWISASICQTATRDDYLLFGSLIADAVAKSDRRVVVLGSGGLSHRFWSLRELRNHESSHPDNISVPAHRDADHHVIERLAVGDHAAVIDGYDDYRKVSPEGRFGHYAIIAGALGGRSWTAPGVPFSDYEAAAGTGQIHMWFEGEVR